jgi:hypothetical protein
VGAPVVGRRHLQLATGKGGLGAAGRRGLLSEHASLRIDDQDARLADLGRRKLRIQGRPDVLRPRLQLFELAPDEGGRERDLG